MSGRSPREYPVLLSLLELRAAVTTRTGSQGARTCSLHPCRAFRFPSLPRYLSRCVHSFSDNRAVRIAYGTAGSCEGEKKEGVKIFRVSKYLVERERGGALLRITNNRQVFARFGHECLRQTKERRCSIASYTRVGRRTQVETEAEQNKGTSLARR